MGRPDVSCCRSAQKEWIFQGWRCSQFEAEIEARKAGPQRSESFHKRAMCIQSKTCLEDSQSFADEETQRDDQLKWYTMSVRCFLGVVRHCGRSHKAQRDIVFVGSADSIPVLNNKVTHRKK